MGHHLRLASHRQHHVESHSQREKGRFRNRTTQQQPTPHHRLSETKLRLCLVEWCNTKQQPIESLLVTKCWNVLRKGCEAAATNYYDDTKVEQTEPAQAGKPRIFCQWLAQPTTVRAQVRRHATMQPEFY